MGGAPYAGRMTAPTRGEHRARRRPAPVAVAASALASLGLTACGGPTAHVTMPPEDAAPGVVVRAYLDALEVEDCATARALYRPGRDPLAPWCGEVEVRDSTVDEVQDDGCCGLGEQYAQSVYVPVDLVTRGGDVSLPDGEHPWGYVLVRDADDQPWRIVDEGLG